MSVLCKADAKAQAESVMEVPLNKLCDREGTLQSLRKMIDIARDCAKNPDDPKYASVDPKVREEIKDVVARIEATKPEDIEKVFTENVTDVLMISYIASLTANQLHFAQRLRNDLGKIPDLSAPSTSSSAQNAQQK